MMKTLILGLLMMISVGNARAQQTHVAHISVGGSISFLVSQSTLLQAFADDCNADSLSDYHGASFTSVGIYPFYGTYFLIANGSSSTLGSIERSVRMVTRSNGDMDLYLTGNGGLERGTCSGSCTSCTKIASGCSCSDPDPQGSCAYKTGGGFGGGGSNLGNFY